MNEWKTEIAAELALHDYDVEDVMLIIGDRIDHHFEAQAEAAEEIARKRESRIGDLEKRILALTSRLDTQDERDDGALLVSGLPLGAPGTNLRPSVRRFANGMEVVLRQNDHKPGWQGDSLDSLMKRLREESDELEECITSGHPMDILSEALDVGNFAMMIVDNVIRPHLWNLLADRHAKKEGFAYCADSDDDAKDGEP